MRPEEIDRVSKIDQTRKTEYWRDHDGRPDGMVFKAKPRGRIPPEVVRAQTRCRTAAWRVRNDARKAPDSHQIGMSLLHALVTSRLSEMTWTDRDLVSRMLVDLQTRGFSIVEARNVLRRMRTRYVDPADRAGEPDGDCGPAIKLSGEEENLPF